MSKNIFKLLIFLFALNSYSQNFIGIKVGPNLSTSSEVNVSEISNRTLNSKSSLGFHVGIVSEFEFKKLNLIFRPEIVYTKIKQDYDEFFEFGSKKLSIQKIDIPLLAVFEIKGPLRILAGPSIEYILDTNFDFDGFKKNK